MRVAHYLSAGMLLVAVASRSGAQSAADHIALGDKEYVAMHAPAAYEHYEAAIKADPKNYEALWKAARSAVDLGEFEKNDETRENYFKTGELYARRAVEANPGDAEGHFSLARAIGRNALTQSPRGRVKYAGDVRNQALECLKINPKHAGCLHVMGMWNAEVMRLSGFTRMIAKNFLAEKSSVRRAGMKRNVIWKNQWRQSLIASFITSISPGYIATSETKRRRAQSGRLS